MNRLLGSALALTLAASAGLALQGEAPPETVAAVPVRRAAPPAAAARDATATLPADTAHPLLPTRPADWPPPPPAGLAAWQPAPPARAADPRAAGVAAVPAASAAPPFPYRWIGQLDDGRGTPQQLLAGAQRTVAVRPDAVLDGRWRLLRLADGSLRAQALADGVTVPVPGAPLADARPPAAPGTPPPPLSAGPAMAALDPP